MGCEVFILILVSRVYIGKAFLDNKILLEQLPLPKFIFSTPTTFFVFSLELLHNDKEGDGKSQESEKSFSVSEKRR